MINFTIPLNYLPRILSGDYIRYGAIVKEASSGKIIGHLKETGMLQNILSQSPTNPLQMAEFVSSNMQLMQIQKTLEGLQLISSIGAVASVANLGVSIAGFAIVINKLNNIEKKVDKLFWQSEKILKKVNDIGLKLDLLKLAELESAFEKITKAEITKDVIRKEKYLDESNSSLIELRNYYRRIIGQVNPFSSYEFSYNDAISIYQKYIGINLGILYIEFSKQDYDSFVFEVDKSKQQIEELMEFDKAKMFRARTDYYIQNDKLQIVDRNKYFIQAETEINELSNILNETLARIESTNVEMEYLIANNLSFAEYKEILEKLPTDIILIPRVEEIGIINKLSQSKKSKSIFKKWFKIDDKNSK
jgi:hypothetical protein